MKIAIILGIVAFIALCVWVAKRNGVTTEFQSNVKLGTISINLDEPIDFGYKIVWIAVKTSDKTEIANILELKNIQPSNWKSGFEYAFQNNIFITPQIGEWTLVIGMRLPQGDDIESIEKIEKILNKLSSKFGEAQFFGTHRVVDYCNWIKSVNGKIVRVYSYLGERGENLKVFGEPTEAEIGLNLFNSFSDEAKSESYWDREDLDYADEELVLKIAEKWSLNPIKLTERSDIKKELGLIGK